MRTVERCHGFSDPRGPDVRFFQIASGAPDRLRCRGFRNRRVPADLVERGWRLTTREFRCDAFGLPPELTCFELERRFGPVRQIHVEGFDADCRQGVTLAASDATWVDTCLEGRFLSREERDRLHRHLRLVQLGERPDSVVLDRERWTGPSSIRPSCLHLGSGDLVLPTLRLDLDSGDRIRIAPAAGSRVRIEGPIER